MRVDYSVSFHSTWLSALPPSFALQDVLDSGLEPVKHTNRSFPFSPEFESGTVSRLSAASGRLLDNDFWTLHQHFAKLTANIMMISTRKFTIRIRPSFSIPLLTSVLLCVLLIPLPALAKSRNEPVIDMHLHAAHADSQGPPPIYICAPFSIWPVRDPKTGGEAYGMAFLKHPPCESPLRSGLTDEELMQRTIKIIQSRNVTALSSGPPQVVAKWKEAGGDRILPATPFDPKSGKPTVDELRRMVKSKQIVAFAEVGQQYDGIAANDPRMEPYYTLAEELDVPVGIHMGPGPPGATYFFAPDYRMHLSRLLLLEDVLARHPKLRLWAMHAGWPLGD